MTTAMRPMLETIDQTEQRKSSQTLNSFSSPFAFSLNDALGRGPCLGRGLSHQCLVDPAGGTTLLSAKKAAAESKVQSRWGPLCQFLRCSPAKQAKKCLVAVLGHRIA
jgi:hypothetical protein